MKVACASQSEVLAPQTCSGSADPSGSYPQCYEGSAGALGLKEDVKATLLSYADGKGTMDLTGSGVESINCTGKSFSKSGQDISPDISDCLPKLVTVKKVEYCSDQDTVSVTVSDSTIPLPVSATLKKVACASQSEVLAPQTCSGSADPSGSYPQCYEGSAGALGLKEDVKATLLSYADGKGTMDLTGSGVESIN